LTSLSLIALLAGGLSLLPTGRIGAQVASQPEPAECLGFAFGRFVPPLDLEVAGHHHLPSPDKLQKTPESRDWAARDSTAAGQMLMLYPAWWPVGVQVMLPRSSTSDTIRGVAYALVADGRVTSPQAQVLAWPVPCGRAGRATAPPPVAGAAPAVADSASRPRAVKVAPKAAPAKPSKPRH
jgi:hypothetical protein